MDPARWQRIEELFHAASDLPSAARLAYLETECPDPEIRQEVVALLESMDGAEDPFRDAVRREAEAVAGGAPIVIGPYRVERKLGEGGMGAVYLATRADGQFEKRVAVKVIGSALRRDSNLVRRFLNERQILAGLEHPGIARLLDGGITEDGVPYLAMEFVDGQPLDRTRRSRPNGRRPASALSAGM